ESARTSQSLFVMAACSAGVSSTLMRSSPPTFSFRRWRNEPSIQRRFQTQEQPAVKGGVKLDHWGGVKVDQYSMVEDQGLSGRRASGAEACGARQAGRLGRGGRRPPPRGVFAAGVAGGS